MMKTFQIALLALACSRSVSAQESKPLFRNLAPYVVLIAGNGADLITTRQAFTRGGTEINPLTSAVGNSATGITAIKVGLTSVLAVEMHYLASHGHPKAARLLGYVDGSAMGLLAWHNAKVLR